MSMVLQATQATMLGPGFNRNCETATTRDTGVMGSLPGGPNHGSAPNIALENLWA